MIVVIGRLSVAIGIIVSLITISTGYGSKKAIKERLADFSGNINVKSTRSNSSYNTSVLDNDGLDIKKIAEIPEVAGVQKYATVTGIMRTEKDFAGIIFKGIGTDFDSLRFKKFLVQGISPKPADKGYFNGVTISQKIAADLHLKLHDSIVTVFSKEDQQPIYRKFEVVGIYKTDIKLIDDQTVLGDINHVRKIQNMSDTDVGGLDIFIKDYSFFETFMAKLKKADREGNSIPHVMGLIFEKYDSSSEAMPAIEKFVGYKNYLENALERYPQIKDWISIFDINIALIIVIMLIVVIINIIMVLLILIIERTNSIGLLKTLGATNRQIRATFINYTLIIMIPGLAVGNAIGLSLLFIQKYFGVIKLNPENYYVSTVPVDLDPLPIISISFGILIISGLALIIPSYLISKISPVKAIKYN